MNKYPKYKSSGVEWIGEIPEHWETSKYKYNLSILSGFPFKSELFDKKDGFPIMRIRDISSGNIETFYKGEYDEKYIIRKEDIVIGMDGEFNVRQWDNSDILLNQRCCKIERYGKYDSKYVFYTLPIDLKIINELTYFTTVKHLSVDDIKSINCILPPLPEQQQIVQFLDEKTELIDKLISTKERKIDLLKQQRTSLINEVITKGLNPDVKMKDSGVEWIGEIPEHWERKKIKTISLIFSKGTTPSTIGKEISDEGEIRYLKSENIVDNSISDFPRFFIDNETNEILKRSILVEGDILFVIAGASIGKTTVLPKEYSPSNTNQAVSFIRLKQNENNKFVWYWLISSKIQEQMWVVAVQSAQPNLSMENLGNFFIPYPTLKEQHQIVEHLDNLTKEIDDLISMEQKKIDLLKEYRQSLISEVITGKIDVRNYYN